MLIGVIAEELLLPFVDLGEIVAEAAAAADVADAAAVYGAVADEAATAVSSQDAAMVGVTAGAVDEAATAASTQDGSVISAVKSRMIPRAFVNYDTSREANVAGIMVNV